MTPDQHRAQVNAVRASLLLAESRSARHEVYRKHTLKSCSRCGQPGGFMWCDRCDSKRAAA